MYVNHFSSALCSFFPAVIYEDCDGIFYSGPTYKKFAHIPTEEYDKEIFSIPYVDAALEYMDSAGDVAKRRIALVTDCLDQAVRTAQIIANRYNEIVPYDIRKYYSPEIKTFAKNHDGYSRSFFRSSERLTVFDFNKAQSRTDPGFYKRDVIDIASCWNYLFCGMNDFNDKDFMVRILNSAGGRIQFFMVSENDLNSTWFETLRRDEEMYVLRLDKPDNTYYASVLERIFSMVDFSLEGFSASEFVSLAEQHCGPNMSEEDLVWELDKAHFNSLDAGRITIRRDDIK